MKSIFDGRFLNYLSFGTKSKIYEFFESCSIDKYEYIKLIHSPYYFKEFYLKNLKNKILYDDFALSVFIYVSRLIEQDCIYNYAYLENFRNFLRQQYSKVLDIINIKEDEEYSVIVFDFSYLEDPEKMKFYENTYLLLDALTTLDFYGYLKNMKDTPPLLLNAINEYISKSGGFELLISQFQFIKQNKENNLLINFLRKHADEFIKINYETALIVENKDFINRIKIELKSEEFRKQLKEFLLYHADLDFYSNGILTPGIKFDWEMRKN